MYTFLPVIGSICCVIDTLLQDIETTGLIHKNIRCRIPDPSRMWRAKVNQDGGRRVVAGVAKLVSQPEVNIEFLSVLEVQVIKGN